MGLDEPVTDRGRFTTRGPIAAAATLVVVLTALSGGYGYHRDELYFAMLPPAWGYVDQPPLVPLIAGALGASPWLLRIPATLCAAGSVLLIAAITRELAGAGGRHASSSPTWAAWAYAGTIAVLDFGHLLLTSTLDLVFWPLTCWLVVRAELRQRPRLWLVAGAVAGAATYNRLLVAVLLTGIAVGLLVTRPRRLVAPHVVGGAVLTVVVGLPNLIYQATHGWPQLAVGAALSDNNSGEVRWFAWVFLVIVLGPVLLPVWLAGLHALWTRPDWRPVRFLVPTFGVVVGFTVVSGAQPHYPTFLVGVLLAAGVAALGDRLRRPVWHAAVALNAAVAAVISLPLLPVDVLGRTPIPAMNQLTADQVGWPEYVAQIRTAYDALPDDRRGTAVVITSNYGEAGAVHHFTDLPVFSGHNALADLGPPPEDADTVVFVGGQLPYAAALFDACRTVDRLDNGVGVENEEQGMPVAVCSGPRAPWSELWPRLRHLD